MSDSETALEHLRLIRGIMEKATVYRTVTVPTALVGGSSAVVASLALYLANESLSQTMTISVWLAVFLGVNLFHHALIFLTSRKEQEPYLSSGLRLALKAIAPPLFCGGVIGLSLGYGPAQDLVGAVLCWTTFYGLSLLATHGFSPRSLRLLGLAFSLVGCLGLFLHWGLSAVADTELSTQQVSALIMGATFGVLHLIYGLAVRTGKQD